MAHISKPVANGDYSVLNRRIKTLPEGHQKLAGQVHNSHSPLTGGALSETFPEPLGQLDLRLAAHPAPSQFNAKRAHSALARLADALLTLALAAVVGAAGQTGTAVRLSAAVITSPEELMDQKPDAPAEARYGATPGRGPEGRGD